MAKGMATKARNGRTQLETAIRLLFQSQTQLFHTQTQFLSQLADVNKRFARADEKWARSDERFARIEKDLDLIKGLLIKHEEILQKLPDVIREKIGFKSR